MKRKKRIEKILLDHFSSWSIEVRDQSFFHRGHNNFSGKDETHFIVTLQSEKNKNFNRLLIHKKINRLLKNEFLNGLHALEIKIKF